MRSPVTFLAVVLSLLCCTAAMADPVDFQLGVQDPPQAPGSFYTLSQANVPFDVNFGQCPAQYTGDGCFVVENGLSTPVYSLDFSIPDTDGVVGQVATCLATGAFASLDCPAEPINGTFELGFDNGAIAPGNFFVIIEDGVAYSDFPPSTAVANEVNVTPEPPSVALFASGLLMAALLAWRARRGGACLRGSL